MWVLILEVYNEKELNNTIVKGQVFSLDPICIYYIGIVRSCKAHFYKKHKETKERKVTHQEQVPVSFHHF